MNTSPLSQTRYHLNNIDLHLTGISLISFKTSSLSVEMSGIASFFLLEVEENVNRKYVNIHFDPIPDNLVIGLDDVFLVMNVFFVHISLSSGHRKSINYLWIELSKFFLHSWNVKFQIHVHKFQKLCMAIAEE